jgi:MTH538 TIR-like domain (DUF1863)
MLSSKLARFSMPPGYDFQRRLNQELEDKSMVVLLESRSLKDSKWTQHEIDFAKRYRLGMLALRMPDVTNEAALPSIAPDAREDIAESDFIGPPRARSRSDCKRRYRPMASADGSSNRPRGRPDQDRSRRGASAKRAPSYAKFPSSDGA